MSWLGRGAAAAAATAGGVAVGRALARRGQESWPEIRSTDDDHESRWQVVTVNRPGTDLLPDGRLPEPLARLGDGVEVRLRPAPGDRGTELAARLRTGEQHRLAGMAAHLIGDDPRLAVRAALRQSKQLAETGELLNADRPPTTRRGVLHHRMERAIEHAREEGRL